MELYLPGLRRVREARCKSMKTLADEADVAKGTIIRIEHHGKPTRGETAEKLARALEVDVAELASKEGAVVPLVRRSVSRPSRPAIEVLRKRLAQLQEHGEEDWQRWSLLQVEAQLLLERTRHEATREQAEEVARLAYNGLLDALGIDRDAPDAVQAIDEMLDDSGKVAGVKEHVQA